jgi:hypothetical protein
MDAMRRLLLPLLAAATLAATEVPASDLNARAAQRSELIAYVARTTPDYRTRYSRLLSRIRSAAASVAAREAAGQSTSCSHQILTEASDISGSNMDIAWIERRLDDLDHVLAHPAEEAKGDHQDPADGSWGACHDQWFFKVNATFDHLAKKSSADEKPRFALGLFDRVNSPEKLQDYFTNLAVSDLPRTGIDHRKELNESLANLTRLILHDRPAYYAWHPRLKETLMDLILQRLRNPRTGWWGESYIRNGRQEFVDDLSITFHVISYLHGEVPDLGRAMEHLLAVKNLDYPIGWLENGKLSNHNNMDVAVLFRYGWRYMNDAQKRAAAAEIRRMATWCLHDTLQPDGSFKADEGSTDAIEEANSWGVSLLSRIGFFDAKDRFWTDEKFPEAEPIREKLIAFIEKHQASGGAGGAYYEDDLATLKAAKPDK